MKKLILQIIFISIILYTAFNCSSNPITPPEDQPGRRDYEWTIDTINYPNSITRIWGSSPTDVWAVGPAGDLYKTIWHFDGEKWLTDNIFRPISPSSIFGFSPNNVYIGSGLGRITHFDGNQWTIVAQLTKDGHNDIVFEGIWGTTTNIFGSLSTYDLYAFGAYADKNGYLNKSVIAHFYKGNWEMINTNGLVGIIDHLYENKSKDIFIHTVNIGGGKHLDSTLIYEYSNGTYIELYSSIWESGLQAEISLISGDVYFILGNKITKRVNNHFQTYLVIDNPNFYQNIWGRNSKDIFLSMIDGVAHYNGTDIEYLFQYNKPSTYIFEAAIFENEVFFLVTDYINNLNLIYHGKLKGG